MSAGTAERYFAAAVKASVQYDNSGSIKNSAGSMSAINSKINITDTTGMTITLNNMPMSDTSPKYCAINGAVPSVAPTLTPTEDTSLRTASI